jgi:uncharacterized membrane protein YphA (DoxX/SURF4 family)
MKELKTVKGRSLLFNVIFVGANIISVILVLLSFLPQFEGQFVLLLSLGLFLFATSTFGIIVFKGRLLLSNVTRLITGSVFVLSGLVKANDPVGFSYKLEEYLQDGAIAYRLKEWMGSPSFSLESWIPLAIGIGVFICILEIIIGVLLMIGGKIGFTAWMAAGLMLFFTFLTWHSVSCDPKSWYTDQDMYKLPSREGYAKLKEAAGSNRFFEVEKTESYVTFNEQKHPHCVSDCGCFGDAFGGSIGRSLTPQESFFKDIFLLYLVFWIFLSQWIIKPNKARQNIQFILWGLGFTSLFCFLFSWYFPLLFLLLTVVAALWMLRVGGVFFSNYWGSILAVAFVSGLFILYVMYFDPVKDFRPYAVDNDLRFEMNNGKPSVYENAMILKNNRTGEEESFSEKEYMRRKDLWNEREYKFIRMDQKVLIPGRSPSVTEQFDPTRKIQMLSDTDRKSSVVKHLLERKSDQIEISLRNTIVTSKRIVLINAPDLKRGNWNRIDKWKKLKHYFDQKDIPVVLLTASSEDVINEFRNNHNLEVPVFINDVTELKTISRSNPSLVYLEKGVIKGKFTSIQVPSVERFEKEFGK